LNWKDRLPSYRGKERAWEKRTGGTNPQVHMKEDEDQRVRKKILTIRRKKSLENVLLKGSAAKKRRPWPKVLMKGVGNSPRGK